MQSYHLFNIHQLPSSLSKLCYIIVGFCKHKHAINTEKFFTRSQLFYKQELYNSNTKIAGKFIPSAVGQHLISIILTFY